MITSGIYKRMLCHAHNQSHNASHTSLTMTYTLAAVLLGRAQRARTWTTSNSWHIAPASSLKLTAASPMVAICLENLFWKAFSFSDNSGTFVLMVDLCPSFCFLGDVVGSATGGREGRR